MRLKAIRAHFVSGRRVDPGDVYEVDESTGFALISANKSALAPRPPAVKAEEPKQRRRRVMTTKTIYEGSNDAE